MSFRPVVVALLVVVAFSVVGAAATTGEPSIDVFAPENVVEPGEETSITLEFRNSGSVEDDDGPPGSGGDVTEARNVSVELLPDDAPVSVKTDTTPLPALGQDAFVSESFTIAVDEDASADSYELEAEITYDYVPEVDSDDGPDDEVTVTETETVELVVEERARFSAETVGSDVRIGETGTVELALENRGVENASDAVVVFDSPTGELTPVDGQARRYVGEWGVDETVSVDAGFALADDALARTYPVTATVEFRDGDGVDRSSRELRVGAPTAPEESFEATVVDSGLTVGETGTVELALENDRGVAVEDAVVTFDSPHGDLETALGDDQVYVGEWGVGETVSVDAGFALADDALARTYPVTATVEFREGGAERVSRELRVGAEAGDRTFAATDVDSGLLVGDDGEVAVTLENEGGSVEDAVVTLDSPDGELEPVTDDSRRYVGDWAAGERATVATRFELAEDATPGSYPVTATVDYRAGGGDRLSREVRVGAETDERQSFDARTVTSDLRVGEDGTVTGYVINEGPRPADGVVVAVDDPEEEGLVPTLGSAVGLGPNVAVGESQYYVGSLAPGESSRFALEFGVAEGAEPGPRLVETEVRYRNVGGDVRTTDVVDVPVEVGDSREEFALEGRAATVEVGDTDRLEVAVTNTYGETLTDVEAKLFTNDPLERGDDEAFIPRLEPGETATIAFELSAAEGATPQTYPARVDFRYDDADGDGRLSDTYRIPVSVVEPADEGLALGWAVVGLAAFVALAGAGWRFRERLAAALPWPGTGPETPGGPEDVGTAPVEGPGDDVDSGDDAVGRDALTFDGLPDEEADGFEGAAGGSDGAADGFEGAADGLPDGDGSRGADEPADLGFDDDS